MNLVVHKSNVKFLGANWLEIFQQEVRNIDPAYEKGMHGVAAVMGTKENVQRDPTQLARVKSGQRQHWESAQRRRGRWRKLRDEVPGAMASKGEVRTRMGGTQTSASDAPAPAEKTKFPNRPPAGPRGSHVWPPNGHFSWAVMPGCSHSFIHPFGLSFLFLSVIFIAFLPLPR